MRKMRDWEDKPLGWSYDVIPGTSKTGFRYGIFGGTLHIPCSNGEMGRVGYDFKEWFFRIPVLNIVIVLCRISPDISRTKEWLLDG